MYINNEEITSREVIASIVILAIMSIIGLFIGGAISDKHEDKIAEYNKALKISNDNSIFTYAMKTNVGNAFIEGDLKALDPVSYSDVEGEYLVIEKVTEEYTRHTETVTYVDEEGNTQTKEEEYYTWDEIDREVKKATKVSFLDVTFDFSKFQTPYLSHIETEQGLFSDIRYIYSGFPKDSYGTIYTYLANNDIGSNTTYYNDSTIEQVLEDSTTDFSLYLFILFWSIFTGCTIYHFCISKNDWLNK